MLYEVDVSRMVSQYKTFVVEASCDGEACHKAKELARKTNWKKIESGGDDIFYVECCEPK